MANQRLSSSFPYSSSSFRWDPHQGSATPPPQRPCSVPFVWEEIPGKPKDHHANSYVKAAFPDIPTSDGTGQLSGLRRLELPPRLVAKMEALQRAAELDPSTTVLLDGPGLAKSGPSRVHVECHSFSYYREAKKRAKKHKDSWFWPKRNKNVHSKKLGDELKIRVPTLPRNRSLTDVSVPHHHHSSNKFWANIRENLKQVVHWRKQAKNHH